MKCPSCSLDLSIIDRKGIEIDCCPGCHGVWLDTGELEKLISRDLSRAASHSPEPQVFSQRMPCLEVWGGNNPTHSAFEMPGLRVCLFSRPQSNAIAGGDIYYLSSCASGRISRILLADVSGHGDSAAPTATKLREIMRQNINRIQQKSFVESLNERFSAITEPSGEFATAIVSTYSVPSKILTMTIAGHPVPMILRANSHAWEFLTTVESESAESADLPLGIHEQVHYSEFSLRINPGDRVLLYSDGLSESRDQNGRLLNAERLHALVESIDSSETETFLATLIGKALELSNDNLAHDDVTAIILEATSTRVPIVDYIFAPFRIIRSMLSA